MSRRELDSIRETALANFEVLLEYWGIQYQKLGDDEYDFLNPTRHDDNFGACRFNTNKARGADFAIANAFSDADFKQFGPGFSRRDFGTFDGYQALRPGFDIIGLCQRIYGCSTYRGGADRLQADLSKIKENGIPIVQAARDAAEKRRIASEKRNQLAIEYAVKLWNMCRFTDFENCAARKYLEFTRGIDPTIFLKEPSIRGHHRILHGPSKQFFSALVFKVARQPHGMCEAIHRIFLTKGGRKADVPEPKMLLAKAQGMGIWFGEPCDTLLVAEGPEEALEYRHYLPFTVSTVSANNYHCLDIPACVKTLYLAPDKDDAGKAAYVKARHEYARDGLKIIKAELKVDG